jgi:hypothetical protein
MVLSFCTAGAEQINEPCTAHGTGFPENVMHVHLHRMGTNLQALCRLVDRFQSLLEILKAN